MSCIRHMAYQIGELVQVRNTDEYGNVTPQMLRVRDRRWLRLDGGRVEFYEFQWGTGQRFGLTLHELEMNGARLTMEN